MECGSPVVLIFMLLLINRRDLMGEHTNSVMFNISRGHRAW